MSLFSGKTITGIRLWYSLHLPFDDSEAIRDKIRERNSSPVIPRRQNSKTGNGDTDWCLYKYRHLVENAFARLKHFRAIATRYDKLKLQFESMLALACAMIWLPI